MALQIGISVTTNLAPQLSILGTDDDLRHIGRQQRDLDRWLTGWYTMGSDPQTSASMGWFMVHLFYGIRIAGYS